MVGTPYWFSRTGGKQNLKHQITPLIPPADTYVEPFVGGGKVLLSMDKYPREVVNDLDNDVYYAWIGMKSASLKTIADMDFTRSRKKFKQVLKTAPSLYRSLYLNINSFGANMRGYGDTSMNPALYKKKLMDHLPKIKERLKDMTILNRDWKSVVREYDGPNTFFYFDPPYFGTRGYGFDVITPEQLFDVLSKLKGKWILSYNDIPVIRKLFSGYIIKSLTTRYTSSSKNKEGVGEVLILNYR